MTALADVPDLFKIYVPKTSEDDPLWGEYVVYRSPGDEDGQWAFDLGGDADFTRLSLIIRPKGPAFEAEVGFEGNGRGPKWTARVSDPRLPFQLSLKSRRSAASWPKHVGITPLAGTLPQGGHYISPQPLASEMAMMAGHHSGESSAGSGDECEIIEIHPQAGDFSEGNAGKILISTFHDDAYYTEKKTTKGDTVAQTEDQKVVISAYVEPKKAGTTIYFEVIDPDDPVDNANAAYKEDETPTTPLVAAGDIKGAVDSNPNDNRDPNRSMFGGTLAKYNAFQGLLSARSDVTVLRTINGTERAVAEVTLTITNRYAGDNYIVRATCIDPEGKPFNDNSGVTADPNADADIDEGSIKATSLLTAWKRVYVEVDKMFRVGADLTADSGADQANKKEIHVNTGGLNLASGDKVQVFDRDDQESPFGEVGVVDSVAANKIVLVDNLTGDYETSKSAHVGKLSDDDDADFKPFYEADVSEVRDMWKHAFVDVTFPEKGAGVYPHRPNDALNAHIAWFHLGLTGDRRNYFHLVGAHKNGNRLGEAQSEPNNKCVVFIQHIEDVIDEDERAQTIKAVTVHELTHQFDDDPALPGGEHHFPPEDGIVPMANGYCVMDGEYHLPSRWCIYHVYSVRDEKDPKGSGPLPP